MANELTIEQFVDLASCLHGDQFRDASPFSLVGKALGERLATWLTELGVQDEPIVHGAVDPAAHIKGRVYIEAGAKVEPTAYIEGPCVIARGAEVRHGAYIRGNVYVGPKAVVGHATEVKGAIFFDDAKAGHFAYVGDSILGRNVNLGAGTKLANLALRRAEVRVRHPETSDIVGSGLTKFSAIMADNSQTGCNAVLSPGTILMQEALVGPCVHYRGTLSKGERKLR